MIDSLSLNRQLGETANMIAIGFKAGYDLPLIITNLATQLPEPAKSVIEQIAAKMASGHPVSQAFQDVAQTIPSDALMKIAAALTATPPARALEAAAVELID